MPKLEHAPPRLSDHDVLTQARRDVRWIASLIGKERWATEEMLTELRERVRTLEQQLRENTP